MEQLTYTELLRQAGRSGDNGAMQAVWSATPKQVRSDPEVVAAYARLLIGNGLLVDAEALTRDAIRHQWSEQLAYLYGLIDLNPSKQLSTAEGWLEREPHNPLLLLTLGRLCLRNRLWGKGKSYLEASIGLGPRAETYQELGALLESGLAEREQALRCYRQGLSLALGADAPTPACSAQGARRQTIAAGGSTAALPSAE